MPPSAGASSTDRGDEQASPYVAARGGLAQALADCVQHAPASQRATAGQKRSSSTASGAALNGIGGLPAEVLALIVGTGIDGAAPSLDFTTSPAGPTPFSLPWSHVLQQLASTASGEQLPQPPLRPTGPAQQPAGGGAGATVAAPAAAGQAPELPSILLNAPLGLGHATPGLVALPAAYPQAAAGARGGSAALYPQPAAAAGGFPPARPLAAAVAAGGFSPAVAPGWPGGRSSPHGEWQQAAPAGGTPLVPGPPSGSGLGGSFTPSGQPLLHPPGAAALASKACAPVAPACRSPLARRPPPSRFRRRAR